MNDTQRLKIAFCHFSIRRNFAQRGKDTLWRKVPKVICVQMTLVYERTKFYIYFQKADINALFVTKRFYSKIDMIEKEMIFFIIYHYSVEKKRDFQYYNKGGLDKNVNSKTIGE